jgi:hypothetical protein
MWSVTSGTCFQTNSFFRVGTTRIAALPNVRATTSASKLPDRSNSLELFQMVPGIDRIF